MPYTAAGLGLDGTDVAVVPGTVVLAHTHSAGLAVALHTAVAGILDSLLVSRPAVAGALVGLGSYLAGLHTGPFLSYRLRVNLV